MTDATSPQRQRGRTDVKESSFVPLASLFDKYITPDSTGYISQEFQDFGYRLALALDDLAHKSLYMKLAKQVPRALLEQALGYVADAKDVQSKGKLFMWRLKTLRARQPGATVKSKTVSQVLAEGESADQSVAQSSFSWENMKNSST